MRYQCMKNLLEKNSGVDIKNEQVNGFFELQDMSLPAIPWKEYTGKENLQDNLLWTVRSAVFRGDDLNLPRLVGVNSKDAREFANRLLDKLHGRGMVVFYPYFVANKSGTLEVRSDKIIIEAVKADLWNMVTFSERCNYSI